MLIDAVMADDEYDHQKESFLWEIERIIKI